MPRIIPSSIHSSDRFSFDLSLFSDCSFFNLSLRLIRFLSVLFSSGDINYHPYYATQFCHYSIWVFQLLFMRSSYIISLSYYLINLFSSTLLTSFGALLLLGACFCYFLSVKAYLGLINCLNSNGAAKSYN